MDASRAAPAISPDTDAPRQLAGASVAPPPPAVARAGRLEARDAVRLQGMVGNRAFARILSRAVGRP